MKSSVADRVLHRLQGFTDALEKGEPIGARFTCRQVELDLRPTAYTSVMVKEARNVLEASQTVFAKFLGVSPKTVRSWEQGASVPGDMACRFLDEIRFCPSYWSKRFKTLVRIKKSVGAD